MFKLRADGNAALQPLLGSHTPWQPPTKLIWHPVVGDLKHLRSRRGFLVPASDNLRVTRVPQAPVPLRMTAIVDYLQTLCQKCAARPTYVDLDEMSERGPTPRPQTPMEPKADGQDYQQQAEAQSKRRKPSEPLITNQEWEEVFPFLREEPPKKITVKKVRAPKGKEQIITNQEWAELFPRWNCGDLSTVGPRVYLPWKKKRISEWTTNFKMTKAWDRRTTRVNAYIKRLEDHSRHGTIVRLTKMDRDADSRLRFLEFVQKADARADAARRVDYSSSKKKKIPADGRQTKGFQPQAPQRFGEQDARLDDAIAATALYNLQQQLQQGEILQPSGHQVRWDDMAGRSDVEECREQLPQASVEENRELGAGHEVEKKESYDYMR